MAHRLAFLVVLLLAETLAARPTTAQEPPWEALNRRGLEHMRQGQLDAAAPLFHEALRHRPHFGPAYNNLGYLYGWKGLHQAAIPMFREAIRLWPDQPAAHAGLGAAYNETGQYDAAIQAYVEALRLKPDYAPAHSGLGFAQAHKGQYDAAIRTLQEALRLDPTAWAAHANLAHAYHGKGSYDAAIAWAKEVVLRRPEAPWAHFVLGLASAGKGDRRQALAEVQWLRGRDPKRGEALFNRIRAEGGGSPAAGPGQPPASSPRVTLRAVRVDPVLATAGQTVDAVLEYRVEGVEAGGEQAIVEEQRIEYAGKVVGTFTGTVRRAPGTYRSRRPIKIPITALPGGYAIVGTVRIPGGVLGMQVRSFTPEMTKASSAAVAQGALVTEVLPDGPAARAGIRPGDVVMRFQGREVASSSQLVGYLTESAPGETPAMTVLRDGREWAIRATLAEPPPGGSSGRTASAAASLSVAPR